MIKYSYIFQLHQIFLEHYKVEFNVLSLKKRYESTDRNEYVSLDQFVNSLTDSGSPAFLSYLRNSVDSLELFSLVQELSYPILVFNKKDRGLEPIVIIEKKNEKVQYASVENGVVKYETTNDWEGLLRGLYTTFNSVSLKNEIFVITCLPNKISYTKEHVEGEVSYEKPSPLKRLMRVINLEKDIITYVYIYSIFASMLSLTLPLGVQAIIGFVSSGTVPTSVAVLILMIVLGILLTGGLQLMQLSLVEKIQQRLFVKTAFEFAFRIPKLKIESVLKFYPPELMNRFFDITTLQKGLAKILVEYSAALVQIVLGLLLLAFYHTSFIFFGILLFGILYLIVRLSADKGLKTSLKESKYKYQLANWLEEIARALSTFKLAGYSNLPMEKTDYFASQYLYSRKSHFKVLAFQYGGFILFKTLITGGLLVLGCVLVINKEINIGQFVASEIVIILIMNAIEKIVVQLDTVYDVLTSIEKIGNVIDLPIETSKGIDINSVSDEKGFSLHVKNLKYKFPSEPDYILKNINITIDKGEHVCISGYSSSGKTTLLNILLGFLTSYEGVVAYNGLSLHDINKNSFIDLIGDNVSQEDLFDGTVLENITIGRNGITMDDVLWAVKSVDLDDFIFSLPDGLNTHLIGGTIGISESIARRILIARSIVKKPKLLILEDFLMGLEKQQKINLLQLLLDKKYNWTLIIISNDIDIMKLCDRTILMKEGEVVLTGAYDDIKNSSHLIELL